MADEIKTGDEVEITIRGKVGGRSTRGNTHEVKTESGITHFVYLGGPISPMIKDGETEYGITLKKMEAPFKTGQAYVDADGDIFLRTDDNRWIDSDGDKHNNFYARRPIVKLVPEV